MLEWQGGEVLGYLPTHSVHVQLDIQDVRVIVFHVFVVRVLGTIALAFSEYVSQCPRVRLEQVLHVFAGGLLGDAVWIVAVIV